MKYYSHNQMKEVNKEFTPNFIRELKSFLVERYVDNMSTKDLVQYVFDDMTQYVDNQSDVEFLEDARNYWDDSFDDVVEEIKEFTDCDFKKPIEDRTPSNFNIGELE